MSVIHAANALHQPAQGTCTRHWPQSFGQWLYCSDLLVDGEDVCQSHLEERREQAKLTLLAMPIYSFDGAWIYTGRVYGWLPVAGTQPLPPRADTPMRFLPMSSIAEMQPRDQRGRFA